MNATYFQKFLFCVVFKIWWLQGAWQSQSTSKHCAAKCRFVTPVFGKYFTYFDPIGKTLFSWNNGLCMSRWKRSNTYSFICKRGCAEGHQWSGIFFQEKKKKTNSKCADHVLGNCSGKRCKNLTIIFLQWAYKSKDNSPFLKLVHVLLYDIFVHYFGMISQ